MKEKQLIFTEALGCAPIAHPMLDSYFAHHENPLTLFIYDDEDFVNPKPELLTVVRVSDSPEWWYPAKSELKAAYSKGHRGTALLWARIFSSDVADRYIHLDADNIYLGNVVDEINQALDLGYDLVGYRRPYAKAPNKLPLWQKLMMFLSTDTVHTFSMGVRIAATSSLKSTRVLEREMLGFHRFGKLGGIVANLDFFDRTSKRISPFARQTFFLEEGAAPKSFGKPSEDLFKKKFLNFSAVGSGFNFWLNQPDQVPESYVMHAKKSFALYNELFLGLDCHIEPLNSPELVNRASKIDRTTWIEIN
jgi:hypothetical protein